MRLKWIILAKIRRRDMKEKLDVDIIVRTLKKYQSQQQARNLSNYETQI